jgi:hypothetical protein
MVYTNSFNNLNNFNDFNNFSNAGKFFDGATIFVYIVIIILFLALFNQLSIGLNIIFGLILALIVIWYINKQEKDSVKQREKNDDIKATLRRVPNKRIDNYPDFNDFLFSIQELYGYSPPNYENIVDSIDDLIILYENSISNPQISGYFYDIAVEKKNDALNALHSIIFSVATDERKYIIEKNDRARTQLSYLMNIYVDKIYGINERYNLENGFTNTSKINTPESWPKPENYYTNIIDNFSEVQLYSLY